MSWRVFAESFAVAYGLVLGFTAALATTALGAAVLECVTRACFDDGRGYE